ncbi:unnamed protein product [Trichobilharzia szidati]|nr:unnamed protein product [Trichobilharzia szidati]
MKNTLPGRVSGNEACRTYLGNRCNPVNGSNYYTCTCIGDYKYSPEYPFYNCYGRKSICDNVICRNRGTCISSQDGYNFICQCQYGWGGRYCEEPDIRQWLPWESWTTCSAPLCGGQGWTSRKRRCRVPVNETTGLGKCAGNTLELRPCKTGCPDSTEKYIPMIKMFLLFAACLIGLQLLVGFIFILHWSELV